MSARQTSTAARADPRRADHHHAASASGVTTSRVRIAGPGAFALAEAVKGDPDVAIYSGDVTVAGRVELLPFLHEQAVSVTAHRFGNPDPAMEALQL